MPFDTAWFRETILHDPELAEAQLISVGQNRQDYPKYDNRWFDHREQELFTEYCRRKEWASAKREVRLSTKPQSQEGRKKQLEELSGMSYDQI